MKDQIKRLVELQVLDSQIYGLRQMLDAIPRELAALEAAFKAQRERLAQLEEKSKGVQLARRQKELELETKEQAIQKFMGQQNAVKTNKEYQALTHEIATQKADQGVLEEQILVLMEEGDGVQKQMQEERQRLVSEETRVQGERARIEAQAGGLKTQVTQLEQARRQNASAVRADLLSNYERILKARGELALVPIQGDSCGGCYMNIPPQAIHEVRLAQRLVSCERCSRLLYVPDVVGSAAAGQ